MSKPDFTGLPVRVMPNARATRVELGDDGGVRVRLQAPAVEGKANAALIRFLAERLEVSRSSVQLLSGEHSRNKVIAVEGWRPEAIREKLLG
jgi:uncharacterized protein (TIGR00251 family)